MKNKKELTFNLFLIADHPTYNVLHVYSCNGLFPVLLVSSLFSQFIVLAVTAVSFSSKPVDIFMKRTCKMLSFEGQIECGLPIYETCLKTTVLYNIQAIMFQRICLFFI